MLLHYIFTQIMGILLQAIEVQDVTNLMSINELTINGLLLVGIVMLWRRMLASEEKTEAHRKEREAELEKYRKEKDTEYERYRKEREADHEKYVNLLMSTTKIIDENTRMYQQVTQQLERLFNK